METTENGGETNENLFTTNQIFNLIAYIRLRNNGLLDRNTNEIIRSIAMENDEKVQPLFASRMPESIKLVFPTKDARDDAVNRKLSIFGLLVDLEAPMPRDQFQRRTIHVFNLPIEEKSRDVEKWLENLGMKVVSEMRWLLFPGTKIRNGGRSYVVSTKTSVEIPGYANFTSIVQNRIVPVQIWYHGMPVWCRRCKEKGHQAKECPKIHTSNNDIDSYAARAAGGYGGGFRSQAEKTSGNPKEKQAETEEAPMVTLIQKQPTVRPTLPKPIDPVPNEVSSTKPKPTIVTFYSKHPTNAYLSNHHTCRFSANDTAYDSTEHYLFSEKAKQVGDEAAMKKILYASAPGKAKQFGEAVNWDEEKYGPWEKFASTKLKEANIYKYQQNADLRRKLFETAPSILVEANPANKIWGVGLAWDNPDINDPTKWRGQNIFGQILTQLRDQFMTMKKYEAEVNKIRDGQREKRKREGGSSSDDGGIDTDDVNGTRNSRKNSRSVQ